MIKFSKEEIELCRKIAEKEWKDIKHGDWYQNKYTHLCIITGHMKSGDNEFPLWTLSDCLEWLREKGVRLQIRNRDDDVARKRNWNWQITWGTPYKFSGKPWGGTMNMERLLNGLLKIVLARLEESQ